MDLTVFLDDGEGDRLGGKRREELGEEIYSQVVKSESRMYEADGVLHMKNGG